MKTERYTMELEQKILFYTTPHNEIRIEVRLEEETFWMSQKQLSELFAVQTQTINYHLKEIFKSKELDEISTIRKIRIVQKEGGRDVQREQNFYNLDAIISVGYRVNSIEATQFRIWATKILHEFIVKGFVLDDVRLKNGTYFGKDYFNELLEKIREIRASERRFYQKITDIYKECSVDYDVNSLVTQEFFQTVQNKLEFAITAPEILYSRTNKDVAHMGLTTWKNSPDGKILKSDVTIAKNYLSEKELGGLNRIVTMYLDFAENQAERAVLMKMKDWVEKLDAFLLFNGYEVLNDFGKVKKSVADKLALEHYSKFRVEQDINYRSDFDEVIVRVGMKNQK